MLYCMFVITFCADPKGPCQWLKSSIPSALEGTPYQDPRPCLPPCYLRKWEKLISNSIKSAFLEDDLEPSLTSLQLFLTVRTFFSDIQHIGTNWWMVMWNDVKKGPLVVIRMLFLMLFMFFLHVPTSNHSKLWSASTSSNPQSETL